MLFITCRLKIFLRRIDGSFYNCTENLLCKEQLLRKMILLIFHMKQKVATNEVPLIEV